MEKILVSACLLGAKVRYDGEDTPCEHPILAHWVAEGRVVPFCPEVAAGLPIPRTPAEIIGDGGGESVHRGEARVCTTDEEDVTDSFIAGAKQAVELIQEEDIKIAVLKDSSPSCGTSKIYDGSFGDEKTFGLGVTTALLKQSSVQVFSEDELVEAEKALLELDK